MSETNGVGGGDGGRNVFVYLDIKIGDEKAGRIIIELFKSVVPKTVENFRALCTGELGVGQNGRPLHFKGTCFHRVVPQFLVQGGDIGGNGSEGESIYGQTFEDENFTLLHEIDGTVGMANKGPNTNTSQFYITTVPCSHLDGINVAFGYVRKGLNVVREISEVSRLEDKPLVECMIVDCGEVKGKNIDVNEEDETNDTFPPWPDDYDVPDTCDVERMLAVIKDSGNYFYKNNNFVDSDRKYRKVLRYIEWITRTKMQHNCNIIRDIKVQTLLNLAVVRLKKQNFKDAIEICSQVLELDPKNGKALYRRGQARLKMKDYDKAVVDLQFASTLFPKDNKVTQDYLTAKRMKQSYLQKERIICSKMFQ